MLKYIINLTCLTVLIQPVFPQSGKYIPSQVKLGTDLTYIGASILSDQKTQFEFNADIDFNRFLVVGDFGTGSWIMNEADYNYENNGTYLRFGADYNFIKPSPDNNAIYIGFRYTSSRFTENFTFQVDDPIYGSYIKEITGLDRTGSWLEFVVGMKARVWKGFFLGWTGRLKFASGVSSPPSTFGSFWMPGFGKTDKDSHWGLNYQIFYRIPLFKKKFSPPAELVSPEE